MFKIETLMVLIPGLPLLSAIITAALGKWLLRSRSHWPAVLAVGGACLLSVLLLFQVRREAAALHEAGDAQAAAHAVGYEKTYTVWTWAVVSRALPARATFGQQASETSHSADPPGTTVPEDSSTSADARSLEIGITLRADPLTAVMLVTVTLISLLVVIYSIGYMHDDVGYWRFFTYVSLFVFSMTMLVSASNFALLYVFWEAVGLCSYLLIGFWFTRPAAAAAGMKAFLVNRVGDFGFALGLFLLWTTYGTLNFHDTAAAPGILGQTLLADPSQYAGGWVATAICLLLLLGACGKSAQFPLHVWLPDAMEGPTPVSALIHAATMVTAGVYMVTRCTPLYLVSADAQQVVLLVGMITALLAAAIALTQTDLKRVLAYSTISQLGYMFIGLGVGTLPGIVAGMFHLFTHAFFKALLFLGAGSVMHAMGGVIDMRRFGGLRRRMPVTHWTFLIGALALAAVAPFAGFWSKDAIVAAISQRVQDDHHGASVALYQWVFWGSLFTAGLTAFYTFRAFFLTFYGEEQIPEEAGHHAHESPPVMTWPLIVLAAASVFVGWCFQRGQRFDHFLMQTPSLAFSSAQATLPAGEHGGHGNVAVVSTLVALIGIGLAAYLYLGDRWEVAWIARRLRWLYTISYRRFFIDPIYMALFVWPLRGLAAFSYWLDRQCIDRLVDWVGRVPLAIGASVRALQSGLLPFYAMAMVFGLLVLIGILVR